MSLVALTLSVLKDALASLPAANCPSRRILSLGYPDILASPASLENIFGGEIMSKVGSRADSAQILRWHNAGSVTNNVAEATALFAALGFELDVLDLVQARGGEILQDLNEPIPASMHERYAAVIDAGTLEHCFNIAQAATNVASAVALGGFVMHGNPLNMYNHGFYNLNPTWYHDFYAANGFTVESVQIVLDGVSNAPRVAPAPAFGRFRSIPDNATLLVIARRKAVAPLKWPVQTKYRDNPTLRG
jgi:hypothetical protein